MSNFPQREKVEALSSCLEEEHGLFSKFPTLFEIINVSFHPGTNERFEKEEDKS